ncbi:hypothetical protein [Dactylosporangium sp. CA-139066]|uniref:hypothetical protein n=1 Tax=Dactylosporangium sp. CA-139066 TaxID=3239930 RepID=UPI003D8D29A2
MPTLVAASRLACRTVLAQIDLARKDYAAAAPRLVTAFNLVKQLQRPDGIAIVGNRLGQLLRAAGQPDDGKSQLAAAMPSRSPSRSLVSRRCRWSSAAVA